MTLSDLATILDRTVEHLQHLAARSGLQQRDIDGDMNLPNLRLLVSLDQDLEARRQPLAFLRGRLQGVEDGAEHLRRLAADRFLAGDDDQAFSFRAAATEVMGAVPKREQEIANYIEEQGIT